MRNQSENVYFSKNDFDINDNFKNILIYILVKTLSRTLIKSCINCEEPQNGQNDPKSSSIKILS